MKIFVTGGNWFIGSHLVRALLAWGHEVVALRREQSNLGRCTDFARQVTWVNQDSGQWTQQVIAQKPAVILHSAWAGVIAAPPADWKESALRIRAPGVLLRLNISGPVGLVRRGDYSCGTGTPCEGTRPTRKG